MIPDISISPPSNDSPEKQKLLLLDAKYRIEEGLHEAIASIHMYRDALVREDASGAAIGTVGAAYILTPHLPSGPPAESFRHEAMPARLFRPDYRKSFNFGAVTLRPGLSTKELAATLRQILEDAGVPPPPTSSSVTASMA